MKKIMLLLAITLSGLFAFAQWEWQNPLPQGNNLNAISTIEDEVWAVGVNGTIIHSSDWGESWEFQNSNTVDNLADVCFVDLNHGWALQSFGYQSIIKTDDGGINWYSTEKISDSKFTSSLTSICFVDQQIGWAVGWATSNPEGPIIIHTVDGGTTWESQTYIGEGDIGYPTVYFIDQNEGWIALRNTIIHTEDGGVNWELQNCYSENSFTDIFFLDAENGWASAFSSVFMTSNGGETWESSTDLSLIGLNINEVSFIDNNTGWICGNTGGGDEPEIGSIYKTTDGGNTWETQLQLNEFTPKPIYCLSYKSESGGVAAGEIGELLKTTGIENDWVQVSSSFTFCDLFDVFFIDNLNGWACGGFSNPGIMPMPLIYNTNDGGLTWSEQNAPYDGPGYYTKILFTDTQHGWATGLNLTLFRIKLITTVDGGETWEEQLNSYDALRNFFFINNSVGWNVGEEGVIQKTEDGGWNWVDQQSGTDRNLFSVMFINEEIGWIAGDSIILKTENGGNTWEEQSAPQGFCNQIFFIDELHGWVVSPAWGYNSGMNMRTIDGGENWEELSGEGFYEVFFIDSENGWGRGKNNPGGGMGSVPVSNMFITSDGGLTWTLQPMRNLIDGGFCFIDENEGWAVSYNGTIMHTNNGGMAGFNENTFSNRQSQIQNFPNPFSTYTTIKYELANPSTVQLTIYDYLGRQVELIEKMQAQGKQQIVWDAEGLPAGVYFCVIKTNQGIRTTKLIKL